MLFTISEKVSSKSSLNTASFSSPSSNMYAEEMKISYDGGTLKQNGRVILPGSSGTGRHIVAVNKTYVPEKTIGGAGVATLEYRLEEIVPYGSDQLYVFSMRLQ